MTYHNHKAVKFLFVHTTSSIFNYIKFNHAIIFEKWDFLPFWRTDDHPKFCHTVSLQEEFSIHQKFLVSWALYPFSFFSKCSLFQQKECILWWRMDTWAEIDGHSQHYDSVFWWTRIVCMLLNTYSVKEESTHCIVIWTYTCYARGNYVHGIYV